MNKVLLVTFAPPSIRIPRHTLVNWQRLFFGGWANAFDRIHIADIGWQLEPSLLPPQAVRLHTAHNYPSSCLDIMFKQTKPDDFVLLMKHNTVIYDNDVIERATNYAKRYDVVGFDGFKLDYLWVKQPVLEALVGRFGFYEFPKVSENLEKLKHLKLKEDTSRVVMFKDKSIHVSNADAPKTGVYTARLYNYGLELYDAWVHDEFTYANKRKYFKDTAAYEALMWLEATGTDLAGLITHEGIPLSVWQKYYQKFVSHHKWLKPKPVAEKA